MPGTIGSASISPKLERLCNVCKSVSKRAKLQPLLFNTDENGFRTGIPVVVSNPIESEITSAVKIGLENINKTYVRIFDHKEKKLKSQVNSIKDGVMEIVFIASVKSLGFRVYDVRPSDEPCKVKSKFQYMIILLKIEIYCKAE